MDIADASSFLNNLNSEYDSSIVFYILTQGHISLERTRPSSPIGVSNCSVSIKHRVQNPRRVTNPKSIASTHARICPRIIM